MNKQGQPTDHWLTRTWASSLRPPTLLDGAYCNALPLVTSSKTKPCQFSNAVQFFDVALYAS